MTFPSSKKIVLISVAAIVLAAAVLTGVYLSPKSFKMSPAGPSDDTVQPEQDVVAVKDEPAKPVDATEADAGFLIDNEEPSYSLPPPGEDQPGGGMLKAPEEPAVAPGKDVIRELAITSAGFKPEIIEAPGGFLILKVTAEPPGPYTFSISELKISEEIKGGAERMFSLALPQEPPELHFQVGLPDGTEKQGVIKLP